MRAIQALAEVFADKRHALFLGRGPLQAIAMEGALKLKEISYIHAEGYAAAELKHGPLALVDEDMPVVAVAPNNELLEKLKSNLQEVRARGGKLFVFADPQAGMESEDGVTVIQDAGDGNRPAGTGGVRRADAAARLSRRGAQGHRRRSAAQSGQESDGRVVEVPGRSAAAGIFDSSYFRKFYFDARDARHDAAEMRGRAPADRRDPAARPHPGPQHSRCRLRHRLAAQAFAAGAAPGPLCGSRSERLSVPPLRLDQGARSSTSNRAPRAIW